MATGAYYLSLGTGYMLLEMGLIQAFTQLLAEPIYAVALVLAAFLVCSGLGSAWASHLDRTRPRAIRITLTIVIGLATIAILAGRPFLDGTVAWLATDRGLVRISETDWHVYDPTNSPLPTF